MTDDKNNSAVSVVAFYDCTTFRSFSSDKRYSPMVVGDMSFGTQVTFHDAVSFVSCRCSSRSGFEMRAGASPDTWSFAGDVFNAGISAGLPDAAAGR